MATTTNMEVFNAAAMLNKIVPNQELKIGVGKVFETEQMSFYLAQVGNEVPPHYHKKSDETYFIYKGQGKMQVDQDFRDVKQGDIILIPKGSIHGLKNTGHEDLIIFFISSPAFDQQNDRFVPQTH